MGLSAALVWQPKNKQEKFRQIVVKRHNIQLYWKERKKTNKQTRKQQQTFQCYKAARSSAHSKNKQENSNESWKNSGKLKNEEKWKSGNLFSTTTEYHGLCLMNSFFFLFWVRIFDILRAIFWKEKFVNSYVQYGNTKSMLCSQTILSDILFVILLGQW